MANSAKMCRDFRYILHPLWPVLNEANTGKMLLMKETKLTGNLIRTFKSHNLLLTQEKFSRDPSKIIKRDGTVIRKKTLANVMVNLIKDSEVTVLPLQAAENIAKANGLNLIKVKEKVKSSRETYKLVSDSNLGTDESVKESKNKEDLKTIIISSGILDHDLQVKIKSMMKILRKNLKLKCIIKQVGNTGSTTVLYDRINEELKNAGFSLSTAVTRSTNNVMQIIMKNESDNDNKVEKANKKDES